MFGVCVTCLVLSSTYVTMARFGLMELYAGVLVAVVMTVAMKMELYAGVLVAVVMTVTMKMES